MVWVIAFGELFFGDLWCVVWGYGGMRTHFSLLNPPLTPHQLNRGLNGKKHGPQAVLEDLYPVRDLNPCYRRERPAS